MIRLFIFAPAFGAPSASPFCTKAIYLLNLAGVEWEAVNVADPRKFPFGKLPAIEVDGRIIGDSDNIRKWLAEQGSDVDAHLSKAQTAQLIAFQRLAEDHVYFHILMERWGDDRVWPVLRDTYFTSIPSVLRGVITRQIRRPIVKGLHMMGVGRMTEAERLDRLERDFAAIASLVADGPFAFGEFPSSLDATLGAMLGSILCPPLETAMTRRVKEDPILKGYFERVHARLGDEKPPV